MAKENSDVVGANDIYKSAVINYAVVIALIYLAVFIPLFLFFYRNLFLIVIHFIDLAVVIWTYASLKRDNDIVSAGRKLSTIAFLTVFSVTITGGAANSGLFLAFPYIPWVAFMSSKREDILWVLVMLFSLIAMLFFSLIGLLQLPYDPITFALYTFTYIITALIMFSYIRAKDSSDLLAKESAERLAQSNMDLAAEIAEKEMLEKDLRQQAEDLTKLNQFMVGRETKMVELKQEIIKLKSELKR